MELHSSHWKIEQYHRVIKQVCHIEKFQVRRSKLIFESYFCSLDGLRRDTDVVLGFRPRL